MDGYKPITAKLSSLVTVGGGAGFVGNAVLGGGIGAIVDLGTGAAQDLRPNPMIVELAPVESADESRLLTEAEVDSRVKAQKAAESQS